MNDRFNFRIWYKPENKYLDGIFAVARSGRLIIDLDILQDYDDKSSDCIIEQCTGFSDKNGSLIYEGDVVKIGNGSVNGEVIESEIEVEWVDNAGRYNLPTWTSDTPDWSHYVEIIGNIHEQAEQKDVK